MKKESYRWHILSWNKWLKNKSKRLWLGKDPNSNKIENLVIKYWILIYDWNMFKNLIFKTEFSIVFGSFPNHNLLD